SSPDLRLKLSRFVFYDRVLFVARRLRVDLVALALFDFAPARSGSFLLPVSRFHSSKTSLEIFPSIRSSANFRRCAWLLNGMNSLSYARDRGERGGRKSVSRVPIV